SGTGGSSRSQRGLNISTVAGHHRSPARSRAQRPRTRPRYSQAPTATALPTRRRHPAGDRGAGGGLWVPSRLLGSASVTRSSPPEHNIHGPAGADVRTWPAEVREEGGVGAAGFFQGIRKHGEPGVVQQAGGEKAVVVGRLCELQHVGRPPGGGEGDGAEGVAEEV